MKLIWSDLERREVALALVERLRDMTPSPGDLAALTVEVAEIGRESVAHVVDLSPELGTRAELAVELERVAGIARHACVATTAACQAKLSSKGATP